MARTGPRSSCLDRREIQPGELVSLEQADREEQQEKNSGLQDEEEYGKYDSSCSEEESGESFPDDEAAFNGRIEFSLFSFIALVMELWDYRHLLLFYAFVDSQLFVSLILPCLN